ncbi:MAG: N-acetyltransferase [Planctomycetaceae bacterium]
MYIRRSIAEDTDSVKALYVAAFPAEEGETVAELAAELLTEVSSPETFSLVAESDAMIVGHVAFSPVSDAGTDGFCGYILAPLAVHPTVQRQGIGTRLIEEGVRHLAELAVDLVFVYGDPEYYGRFGFQPDGALEYVPPYELQFPSGWLLKALADVGAFASSGRLTCVPSLQRPDIW